jgi:hypothetical protein
MSPYHWGFYYAALCKQAANVAPQQSSQDQQYRRNIGTALTGLGALSTLGSGVAAGRAVAKQLSPEAPWQKQYYAELDKYMDRINNDLNTKPELKNLTPEEADAYVRKELKPLTDSAGSRFRSALWRGVRVPALAGVGSLGLLGTGLYLRSTS